MAMAPDDMLLSLLSGGTRTPIAQLNPELTEQASRTVRGEITITWPYNSVTKTLALILAEPDVRLRRVKGQVRVKLQGSCAKALAETGCGGGDELLILLDGVEWARDESPGRVPGARVDWQLQFSEKLIIQVTLRESNVIKRVHVNHPEIEGPRPATTTPERINIPGVGAHSPTIPPSSLPILPQPHADEYRSPAFIKRARVSYGSLFEDGLDIFEEDGGVRGKGRKRSRFGQESYAWRYSSQSPSPELEPELRRHAEDGPQLSSPSKKANVADEGCQTMEVDTTPIATRSAEDAFSGGRPPSRNYGHFRDDDVPQIVEEPGQEAVLKIETRPEKALGVPNYSLFGTYAPNTAAPPEPSHYYGDSSAPAMNANAGLSLTDQVRFGFSHNPQLGDAQTGESSGSTGGLSAPLPDYPRDDTYPDTYLDRPPGLEFNSQPYTADPDQGQDVRQRYQYDINESIPASENLAHGQWATANQVGNYHRAEGPEFGIETTERGTSQESNVRSEGYASIQVPQGFSTYEEVSATQPEVIDVEESSGDESGRDEPLVQNQETYNSEDEVGVEDTDDAVYDEDGYEVEQGDYDQREYDAPSDDDEGSSEEEEAAEQELDDRYGTGDRFEEEEYSSSEDYDEEEEEGEEEEDEEEEYNEEGEDMPPSSHPARPSAPSEPVVISLLDSSDEEDEVPVKSPAPISTSISAPAPTISAMPAGDTSEPNLLRNSISPQVGSMPISNDKEPAEDRHTHPMPCSQTQVIDFALSRTSGFHHDLDGKTTRNESQIDLLPSKGPYETVEERKTPGFSLGEQARYNVQDDEPGHILESGGDRDATFNADIIGPNHESRHKGASDAFKDEGTLGSKAEADPISDEKDMKHTQQSNAEDVVMHDRSDEEGSEEGLFAQQPRPRQAADNDPDYVDQPDDEVIEEEYESDKEAGLQGLDVPTEEFDKSPRPAAIHAAERAAEQLQQIEEVAAEGGHVSVEDTSILRPHNSEATECLQHNETPDIRMTEEPLARATSTGPEPMALDENPEAQDRSDDAGDAKHEEDLAGSAIVLPPPHPEVRPKGESSPPLQESGLESTATNGHPASTTLSSPDEKGVSRTEAFPRGIATIPPVPILPSSSSPKEVELLPTPVDTQTMDQIPPLNDDDLDQEEIDLIIEVPSMPDDDAMPNYDNHTKERTTEGAAHDAAQEERHSDLPSMELNATVVEGEEEDDVGSVPSPSAQLLGEMDGARSPVTTKHNENPTSTILIQANGTGAETVDQGGPAEERFFSSSPGPGSSQDINEDGLRRSSRRAKASTKKSNKATIASETGQASDQQQNGQVRKKAVTPDPSIQFARQSVAARRAKKAPEPIQSNQRVTRARSSSLQTTATTEDEADHSVALARASIASPSKANKKSGKSATVLKGELTKRFKSELPECLSLKGLRSHLKKVITVVGIVTSNPSRPARAKSGPREYVMSFNITDVTIAPSKVVEVQLYRAHKDALPSVKPGDGILLQDILVQSVPGKEFGLRSDSNSAWAVFDIEDSPPQVKGSIVEDYQPYVDYMETLKEWYRALGTAATEKLEKANQEVAEGSQTK